MCLLVSCVYTGSINVLYLSLRDLQKLYVYVLVSKGDSVYGIVILGLVCKVVTYSHFQYAKKPSYVSVIEKADHFNGTEQRLNNNSIFVFTKVDEVHVTLVDANYSISYSIEFLFIYCYT